MAGFDHEAGRSNNMVAAEDRGMVTVGRWAKRYGCSARAALEVMDATEAHHTGTGLRGKSRLTVVIDTACEPTTEQLAGMKRWDAGERPSVQGWYTAWNPQYGAYGRKRMVPSLAVYRGDPKKAPKKLLALTDGDFAKAEALAGSTLAAYANRFDDLKT